MTPNAVAPAQAFAIAFVDTLLRAGLKHAVVSPGSRSQALALELARREAAGEVQLHVRIDEREAGFFALGLAKGSGVPALVVTTSGSAVANLHPSVVEAHHGHIPVIYATADRPGELQNIEANQTTDQAHIFGTSVRAVFDVPAPNDAAVAASSGAVIGLSAWQTATDPYSGPVHVNVGFREPLSSQVNADAVASIAEQINRLFDDPTLAEETRVMPRALPAVSLDSRPTIILVGASYGVEDAAGRDAARVAQQLCAPVFAEVVSSARTSPNALPRPHALLDSAAGRQLLANCARVVVFGKPTLHREYVRTLQRDDLDVIVVAPEGEDWVHYTPRAQRVSAVTVDKPIPSTWLERWCTAAAHLPEPLTPQPDASTSGVSGVELVRTVAETTQETDAVVFAASSLVRTADNVLPHGIQHVYANRGLAGIDGTISTAAGIAVGRGNGVTRLIVGDLTTLYGIGGLLAGAGEALPPMQIVVGNDHGGSIFDNLEVAAADPELFRRVMRTEQAVDLVQVARAYGWPATRVTTRRELQDALDAHQPGLIEVVLR